MKIEREKLLERGLPHENYVGDKDFYLEDKITENTRWSIIHEIVFEYDGKFYQTWYSVGATEQQWKEPWEYDKFVELTEVRKVQKLVDVWEEVK